MRRVLTNRFPYAIVYLEYRDEFLVVAIAHTSRKPGYWKNRMTNDHHDPRTTYHEPRPTIWTRPMDEILTIAQIDAQFQSEWVLIEEPRTDEALEVQSGKVRWHSKDREEVYRKVLEIHPKRFAILYTGKMPRDTAIVL